jgi:hypothetical protein
MDYKKFREETEAHLARIKEEMTNGLIQAKLTPFEAAELAAKFTMWDYEAKGAREYRKMWSCLGDHFKAKAPHLKWLLLNLKGWHGDFPASLVAEELLAA